MTAAMLDHEKNRAEYVVHLEQQVQHLQRQLNEIQADARWIPVVNTAMQGDTARITLAFGGKRVTATVDLSTLHETTVTDLTSAVLDSFADNLVKQQLREVVEPAVSGIINASRAVAGAGKW